MIKKNRIFPGICALFMVLASVAHAQTQSPVLAYLTDVEGKWQKFSDFLKGNPHVYLDGAGKLQLAPGVTFVYGGDATDSGPDNLRVIDRLNDLKLRYPTRVILLSGNRDLGKIDTLDFVQKPLSPKIKDYLTQSGLKDTPTDRLILLTEMLGYDGAFQDRKKELSRLKQKPVTDDEVANEIIADIQPGGRQRLYLDHSQLMYRDGVTLFVHGAILDENMGIVGNHPTKRYTNVNDWMKDLNQWYADQVDHWEKTGDATELLIYNKPVPKTHQNRASVVLARYTDATGNSRMPSDRLINFLKANGIRRIVVGHTPQGDGPTILRHAGFEVIMADNTDAPHGSKLFITGDKVEVESKVRLPQGEETYNMTWGIDDETLLGHRLNSNDHLLKARLKNGDWVTFQVSPPPNFDVEHQVLTNKQVEKIGVKEGPAPKRSFLGTLNACVFGN